MGCDIHLAVEVRDPGGPWKLERVQTECGWCDGKGKKEGEEVCYWCNGGKVQFGFHERNYDLFAMLADVRNGSGFAGVKTGEGFKPIRARRGVPKDLSAELRRLNEDGGSGYDDSNPSARVDLGEHSFSWLTLKELLAYDWLGQTSVKEGTLSQAEYAAWKKSEKLWPESWAGSVSGYSVVSIDEEDMKQLISGEPAVAVETVLKHWDEVKGPPTFYTRCSWKDTYAACAGAFYDKFLPALKALGRSPGDVRIVFGFR